ADRGPQRSDRAGWRQGRAGQFFSAVEFRRSCELNRTDRLQGQKEPDVALGGDRGETLQDLLDQAVAHGSAVLARITAAAVGRLLAHPGQAASTGQLFSAAELAELADA